VNPRLQAYTRQAVTNNLQKLINKETTAGKRNKHALRSAITEKKVVQKLSNKLEMNNLILTKADKDNTVIIIPKDAYHNMVNDFISQHQFTKVRNNYTNVQQKAIKTAINTCKITIRQHQKWKFTNMNPKAPYIFGYIKLHKLDKPIRPIINWKNSPVYKLATYVTKLLKQTMKLPNAFNVPSSIALMNSLKQIDVLRSIKICSFDIKNMYTSIPKNDLINIIYRSLTHSNLPEEYKQ
jgi:hypothetical protein